LLRAARLRAIRRFTTSAMQKLDGDRNHWLDSSECA
jgi:hypothetical protein